MKNVTQKHKTYRSYIATMKRKRSDALFSWLKELYCKTNNIQYHD